MEREVDVDVCAHRCDVEGKALNLLVSPRLCPHPWPRAMGGDQKNKGKDATAPLEIRSEAQSGRLLRGGGRADV